MNCERFRYWISLKADGRLDAPRLGDLSAHLQTCAPCRGFEDNLQKNKARLQALSQAPVNESFARELLEAARSPRAKRRRGWIVPVVAAGLLAAAVAGFLVTRPPKSGGPTASPIRDRAWLLLAQVANESIERPSKFQSALHDELAMARMPDPPPGELGDAAGFLDRIRRFSLAAPATEDMKRLQDDIRSSGLLTSWRPAGTLSTSDLIVDAPSDPFRKARGLLYAGQANQASDRLREYLARTPDPDLQDDALYWIAFIEARRKRELEALGALYSLWSFETRWLDAPAIAEAQRLAMALGDAKGPARMEIPLWMAGGDESPPGWFPIEITPDEAWCMFEGARGNKGGKNAPVAIEVKGVMYEGKNLEDFKARHPKILAFLQSRMPAVVKFLEEGSGEFEIQMPDMEEP